MSRVVSLVERRAAPNASVVEQLRSLLAEAEAGEVVNLAWASVLRDGSTKDGFAEGPESTKLVGSVALLQHHLSAVLYEQMTDV